jgi:tetratricopeptide (TPR) repeat protein
MFVINPYLRFALIAAGILGGVALWLAFGFWYGFPFLLGGLILGVSYIFLGTVGPAAKVLQTQDFAKAEQLLNLTLKPEWLYSANRAFYYMMKGSIALQRKDLETGEQWLRQAEAIDIPTPNERAMLQIQLAQIEASRQRWKPAQNHLRKAKEANVTVGAIKEQIDQLEIALKQRGQLKAAQRMGRQGHGMMQRSGKRRRPKMR